MINDADHFYLDRHEQKKLVELLREIPELVEALAAAITAGGYPTQISYEPRVSAGERERPLPFNAAAQDASDELHNELSGWVRHVLEYRDLAYDGKGTTVGLARWLDRNMISLALTEGSGTALEGIQFRMRAARRTTKSTRRESVDVTHAEEFRAYAGTAAQLEKVLLIATPINRKRITYLDRCGELPRRYLADGTRVFTVGDVLDAHARKAGAAMSQMEEWTA